MNLELDHRFLIIFSRAVVVLALTCTLLQWSPLPTSAANQTNLIGPAGSGRFGYSVIALPNGNLVVTDPYYDAGATIDVGAVYLYDGLTRSLISILSGSTTYDRIGYLGVTVLANGNFVVKSPYWNNSSVISAGAATWGSATTGVSGVVSSTNSLVGITTSDEIGFNVTALANGNYVVSSPKWNNGAVMDAGAVTLGDGSIGTSGAVSSTNSLFGPTASDGVGPFVIPLTNGNFVVSSPYWDNLGITDAGAATWGSGTTALVGPVSSANSLVGSTANDFVSSGSVTVLTNGNYVVSSPAWDDGGTTNAGAVTWGSGTSGRWGVVSSSNSLVGVSAGDMVSISDVTTLSNGNYVVGSNQFDGAAVDSGAATWGNGASGSTGPVTTSNSLYGTTAYDNVGDRVTALTNGNYVVSCPSWDNDGTANVGAATWVYGAAPTGNSVTAANSLIGSTANDDVGLFVTALSNGNYVVRSHSWNNAGAVDAGAVTLGDGSIGTVGIVSSGNSLVGSTASDNVGRFGIALKNGNFVIYSPDWDNNSTTDAGAVTWGNGVSGITGPVSNSNSLVGSTTDDHVGLDLLTLNNGNYVVSSYDWDNGGIVDAGAVTWGSGTSGTVGGITSANSLVGSHTNDGVGNLTALYNGDYVVDVPSWDYGASSDSGAVTWGLGTGGLVGPITPQNSVLGLVMNQGDEMNFTHNTVYGYLAVGRPAENLVILFWLPRLYLPVGKK